MYVTYDFDIRERLAAYLAEELLRLKGSAHVTTKEIARAVGLSESALYRHFDHKEELFFALLAQYLPAFHEAFQTYQVGTATIQENLVALALAALHCYEHLIPMVVSLLADKELLVQFRATIQPLGVGPHSVFERLTAYVEKERLDLWGLFWVLLGLVIAWSEAVPAQVRPTRA
jgi:AcrR family transcriptional regulator